MIVFFNIFRSPFEFLIVNFCFFIWFFFFLCAFSLYIVSSFFLIFIDSHFGINFIKILTKLFSQITAVIVKYSKWVRFCYRSPWLNESILQLNICQHFVKGITNIDSNILDLNNTQSTETLLYGQNNSWNEQCHHQIFELNQKIRCTPFLMLSGCHRF